jgi:SH3-binding, glutamic acid-rich protein
MQKKQDHILWTLESKGIEHLQIDIGDPLLEKEREFMRQNTKNGAVNGKTVLPPQIFNDEQYVGVSWSICRELNYSVLVVWLFMINQGDIITAGLLEVILLNLCFSPYRFSLFSIKISCKPQAPFLWRF